MRKVHNSRVTQRSMPALKMHAADSVLFNELQKNGTCIYSKDVDDSFPLPTVNKSNAFLIIQEKLRQ